MNIREGFRRIGLLLGILGAIAGLLGTYIALSEALSQKKEKARFQLLAQKYWRVIITQKRRRPEQSPPIRFSVNKLGNSPRGNIKSKKRLFSERGSRRLSSMETK